MVLLIHANSGPLLLTEATDAVPPPKILGVNSLGVGTTRGPSWGPSTWRAKQLRQLEGTSRLRKRRHRQYVPVAEYTRSYVTMARAKVYEFQRRLHMTGTLSYCKRHGMRRITLGLLLFLMFYTSARARSSAGPPVYRITPVKSTITFSVKASVAIEGTFEKWNATLKFASADLSTGVLDIKIDADSVNTGSGMKDDELKGDKFFDVKKDPYITFHSTKIVETGPHSFDAQGTFTIRGISKPETLTFTDDAEGKGTGEIKGTMAFDRKEFGMNSGIPFIRIADRVEVDVDLKATRVSGSPLLFQQ